MANSDMGTSSSNNIPRGEYQVFLNFRGPDTRHGFTSCLHRALEEAGIRVFIDNEELHVGERISGNLLQAIDNSKLYIPIFSKTYASSHWCLRELAKMVENSSKSKEDGKEKVILPIFYHVKPDDVKLKTELYSEAISKLEQRMEGQEKKFSSEEVKTWRQALNEVDGIKGWEVTPDQSEGDLIRLVVHKVVIELQTRQRQVDNDLVGMEDEIAAIENLLDIESGGVQLIGIYGMGGIGKTTLAKIIFNKLLPNFGKNCTFLENVREKAEKEEGLVELQRRLLSDISYSGVPRYFDNSDDGIKAIEETIFNEVLIVLDDVDQGNQIKKLIGVNFLHPGTRILVTTRDKSVLKIRGFNYKFKEHEMMGLSGKDALTLFSRHAFDDNSPPADYYTLSRSIVSTTGGLPLALRAIGSSLFGKRKKEVWEEWLEKLRKSPHDDVKGKLKITYEALGLGQQQIFLDVACFFIGQNKTDAMHMWKDCGFGPHDAIDVLMNRCMIEVLDGDIFRMHDQFRDLGRAIAKEERTRLWDSDDIDYELRSTEVKGSIQALCRQWGAQTTVTPEQIKRFPHLQFLRLRDVIFQGDFTGCLSELKWLDLRYLYWPLDREGKNQHLEATNLLHLEKAVVVNLSGLDIPEDVFEGLIKGAEKLKVLSVTFNWSIRRIPVFSKDSALEKLTISKFRSLTKIDRTIGKLRSLTDLTFNYCSCLEKLPEEIGNLRNLRHLSFTCCGLIELPDSVSQLTSLETLNLGQTKITRLPDSIGRLSNLSSVDLSSTLIEGLPRTISQLLRLQTLHLRDCHRIQQLPELLPGSLTTLCLSSESLVTVPNLSDLTNLVELDLSDGFITTGISNTIQRGDLRWIGSLSKLRKLCLCFSNVCAPTTELGSLSQLEELTLYGLGVPTFEQLPSKLIVLKVYDTQRTQVRLPPSEIVSSSSEELLEDEALRIIQFLESHGTSEMSVRLQEESGGSELQAPELIDHWRGAFHFPSSLKLLKKFSLSGCPKVKDIEFVSMWESLSVFSVEGCTSLKSLVGLSNSKNLTSLTLQRCPSLQVVEGIDELGFLRRLAIDECMSMGMIFYASSSKTPNKCWTYIRSSGELPDSGDPYTWESYREKIMNGTNLALDTEVETTDSVTERGEKAPDSEIKTKDSETQTRDPLQETAKELGKEPSFSQTFERTFMKKDKTFVSDKARPVKEKFDELMLASTSGGEEGGEQGELATHEPSLTEQVKLWVKASGEVKHSKVFGLGNLGRECAKSVGVSSSRRAYSRWSRHNAVSASEVAELKEQLAQKNDEIRNLQMNMAEVMRRLDAMQVAQNPHGRGPAPAQHLHP